MRNILLTFASLSHTILLLCNIFYANLGVYKQHVIPFSIPNVMHSHTLKYNRHKHSHVYIVRYENVRVNKKEYPSKYVVCSSANVNRRVYLSNNQVLMMLFYAVCEKATTNHYCQ